MDFTKTGFEALGFVGLRPIASLRQCSCAPIPADSAGVYAVLVPQGMAITFLARNPGGWFKGKDPTLPVELLRGRWVSDTPVVYIGRASRTRSTSLRKRVTKFLEFGDGEAVGHWGGRLTWQILGSEQLLLGWMPCAYFKAAEAQLLDSFELQYGCLPFANLRRESGD